MILYVDKVNYNQISNYSIHTKTFLTASIKSKTAIAEIEIHRPIFYNDCFYSLLSNYLLPFTSQLAYLAAYNENSSNNCF